MQLTKYTDFGLRVLIFLATADERVSAAEIARRYGISGNHLRKVCHSLMQLGYVHSVRGRTGGMRLAVAPGEISIGSVVRELEPNFDIAECFDLETNRCPLVPACKLKRALERARDSFVGVLDEYTLEDIVQNKAALVQLLTHDGQGHAVGSAD